MRGEYTWVDDETHEATMGAVKAFVGRLQRHEQTDRILSTVLVHGHRRLDRDAGFAR